MISLIVAVSENNVIGLGGDLPWRLAEDLRRFKALTTGKPIVMGRRTYESIGRPLPGRHNIVLTRRPAYVAEGCSVVATPEAAIATAGDADEIMVIGGREIYALFLDRAERIYLTRVHARIEGDTRFPELHDEWEWTPQGSHPSDDNNDHAVEFFLLQRRDRR